MYEGKDLLARGVKMEAKSIEDNGNGISFNIFVFNIQPGITIDYATGDSRLSEEDIEKENSMKGENNDDNENVEVYIINKNTKKFHKETCESVADINKKNIKEYKGTKESVENMGYEACKSCNP